MDEHGGLAFLHALQLSDGTLPIGRFAHSYGLEAWLDANREADAETLIALICATLAGSVATLDGAAVALAHAAALHGDLDELRRIDDALTARKLSAPAREASTLCGRRLASLAIQLGIDGPGATAARAITEGEWPGHLAVVEGTVGAAVSVPRTATVLIAVRGHVAAMISAAVRLGRLGAVRGQALLHDLAPDIHACAHVALDVTRSQLRATLPELEIHAARHRQREPRMFIT
jgi:urease accessory protein